MTRHGYCEIATAAGLRPIGRDQFVLGGYPRGVPSHARDGVGLLGGLVHTRRAVSLGLVNGSRVIFGPGHGGCLGNCVDVHSIAIQETFDIARIRVGDTQVDGAAQQRTGRSLCPSAYARGGGDVLLLGRRWAATATPRRGYAAANYRATNTDDPRPTRLSA